MKNHNEMSDILTEKKVTKLGPIRTIEFEIVSKDREQRKKHTRIER